MILCNNLVRVGRTSLKRKEAMWCSLENGVLKFNVDGTTRGALEAGGIMGVLRDWRGVVRGIFTCLWGCCILMRWTSRRFDMLRSFVGNLAFNM